MGRGGAGDGRPKEDRPRREELRGRLDRYLDLPLALASVVMVLVAVLELSGEVAGPWRGRLVLLGWSLWALFFVEFAAKFALAPVKREYLRRSWLDVLILAVPFLRFLKVHIRLGRTVPDRVRCDHNTLDKRSEEVSGWTWGCSAVGVTWWGH